MYEDEFAPRLSQLRKKKGVSARDMSLSIGQSPGYIFNIESGNALPSMSAFFFICDYLEITPSEFFNTKTSDPIKMREITKALQCIPQKNFDSILDIVQSLCNKYSQ